MQLSRFTDYSLRVLLYLVINQGKRCTLHEIAGFYPVSLDHLRKVVHELSRAGYINTWRGKKGGIELGRDSREILIGDVVQHFEGHDSLISCGELGCRLAAFCTLKAALTEGNEAFFERLNQYTLYDLVHGNSVMVEALQAEDVSRAIQVMPAGNQYNPTTEEV